MWPGSTTDDYRSSAGGPLNATPVGSPLHSLEHQWQDKPHRLVYDLAGEVDRLRTELAAVREENKKLREGEDCQGNWPRTCEGCLADDAKHDLGVS